jgi:hypothetical protein
MKAEFVIMTPEYAEALLKKNKVNRPFNRHACESYKKEILLGTWKVSHQGIAVSVTGRLMDGQHRLTAIKETGAKVPVWLFTGVPDESFDVMDTHRRRSFADNQGVSPAVAQIAYLGARLLNGRSANTLTYADQKRVLETCRDTMQVVSDAANGKTKRTSSPVKLAAVIRILMGEKEEYVLDLMSGFSSLRDNLPPVAMALVRQIDSGQTSAGKDRFDLLARSFIMFSESHRNVVKMRAGLIDAALDQASLALSRHIQAFENAGQLLHQEQTP